MSLPTDAGEKVKEFLDRTVGGGLVREAGV